ncbi:MAG: hypothetical protein KAR42_14680 [candidate division Zixibacteria bacterium]|nr:hypothetical protein [candidate division Zixibacteria bacterium]
MQRVRVIPGAYTGGVIPGDHDYYLVSINGKQAKVQTLSLGEGVFSMWVSWSCLEVVPHDVKLPGGNVKALNELTEWGSAHGVSVSTIGALFIECPTLVELIT